MTDIRNQSGIDVLSFDADREESQDQSVREEKKNRKPTLEEMLAGMAERTGDPDIACFSETFAACGRAGGNMKQIICISRDIITDRISVGMEISASVASGKNEMYVMSVLPFAVVAMMKTLGNEALTGNSLLNVGVKIAALCLFAAAFAVGKKITDITV